MIPFMTGTDDIPPLYMLYAVVVHLDTSNASFSGHYISYVKDLQGNWFRIDDTEVKSAYRFNVVKIAFPVFFKYSILPKLNIEYSILPKLNTGICLLGCILNYQYVVVHICLFDFTF